MPTLGDDHIISAGELVGKLVSPAPCWDGWSIADITGSFKAQFGQIWLSLAQLANCVRIVHILPKIISKKQINGVIKWQTRKHSKS